MTVPGVDVSDYQGAVDWPAVAAAGVGFAIAKATEAGEFVAETFARNWAGIRAAGLVRGAYHFFRPLVPPEIQAEHFLATVKPGPDDLPPALDVETQDGVDASVVVERMRQWLDVVEGATRQKPLIYGSAVFLDGLGDLEEFAEYPLWIADYGASAPVVPGGWRMYTLWQYTSSGTVPGVKGPVDLDVFNGSPGDLAAFAATGRSPSGRA